MCCIYLVFQLAIDCVNRTVDCHVKYTDTYVCTYYVHEYLHTYVFLFHVMQKKGLPMESDLLYAVVSLVGTFIFLLTF